jgi:pimeloyl-ACP methyl ester carboxylesterase
MKDGKQKDLFKGVSSHGPPTPPCAVNPPPVDALYLHGLGSGPSSSKAQIFAEHFRKKGVPFYAPDLNIPSFERLSPHQILSLITERLMQSMGTTVVLGASFGGYLALHSLAKLPPDLRRKISHLVLLAPAIDPWLTEGALLTPERTLEWRERGTYPLLDYRKAQSVRVHYQLVTELEELGVAPKLSDIATTIIHGTLDEIVPVRGSRKYVEDNPSAQLIEVKDDHSLLRYPDLLRRHVDLILQM